MIVYQKELKQAIKPFCIWTVSIAFMMLLCILLFPEMKGEMDSVGDLFANMGGFTAAFGMDKLNFGELMGFYGIECGNILGIGGGFFAALVGISALSKEEKEHTAEFLLTHPVSRFSVITQKLLSVLTQVVLLNTAVVAVSLIAVAAIGEKVQMKEFFLLHLAYTVMQLEISCICFGISSFIKRGSIGVGLGVPLALYFLNLVRNISDRATFLRYVTPYAYAEASDILADARLAPAPMLLGILFAALAIITAYVKYMKKDIAA